MVAPVIVVVVGRDAGGLLLLILLMLCCSAAVKSFRMVSHLHEQEAQAEQANAMVKVIFSSKD